MSALEQLLKSIDLLEKITNENSNNLGRLAENTNTGQQKFKQLEQALIECRQKGTEESNAIAAAIDNALQRLKAIEERAIVDRNTLQTIIAGMTGGKKMSSSRKHLDSMAKSLRIPDYSKLGFRDLKKGLAIVISILLGLSTLHSAPAALKYSNISNEDLNKILQNANLQLLAKNLNEHWKQFKQKGAGLPDLVFDGVKMIVLRRLAKQLSIPGFLELDRKTLEHAIIVFVSVLTGTATALAVKSLSKQIKGLGGIRGIRKLLDNVQVSKVMEMVEMVKKNQS